MDEKLVNLPNKEAEEVPDEIEAEAAAWIARLHGPSRSAAIEREFLLWLASSPIKRAAFESVTSVWDDVAGITTVTAFRRHQPARASSGWYGLSRAAWGGMAVAMSALVVCAAWFTRVTESRYDTPVGEQRTVILSDGSRVALNTDTHLRVSQRDDIRLVKLDSGEAFFEVAKDPTKPFIVDAGIEKITALGTAFSVRRDHDKIAVTLVEGRVAVTETSESFQRTSVRTKARSETTLQLTAGERLVATVGSAPEVDVPDMEQITAWRRGEVVLDETPLSEAVAEMNRYNRAQIILDDEASGQLLISGIFKAGDNQTFAKSVASVYGLRVVTQSTKIHLRREPS